MNESYCLVLAGGGTRGAYQLGAWNALKETGISVRAIAGTSIGAINAAFIIQGTIAKIKQLLRLPGDTIRVLVEGLERARIIEHIPEEEYYKVCLKVCPNPKKLPKKPETEALIRQVIGYFEKYAKLTNRIPSDTTFTITSMEDYARLSDVIAANMVLKLDQKQRILSPKALKSGSSDILSIKKHRIRSLCKRCLMLSYSFITAVIPETFFILLYLAVAS